MMLASGLTTFFRRHLHAANPTHTESPRCVQGIGDQRRKRGTSRRTSARQKLADRWVSCLSGAFAGELAGPIQAGGALVAGQAGFRYGSDLEQESPQTLMGQG